MDGSDPSCVIRVTLLDNTFSFISSFPGISQNCSNSLGLLDIMFFFLYVPFKFEECTQLYLGHSVWCYLLSSLR
jgi:hypothetical protein